VAQVALCSQINAKHKFIVAERKILEFYTVGSSRNQ